MDTPYGTFSFRQLSVMKIADRLSVIISGLPAQFARDPELSLKFWFGAFGKITEIRVLLNLDVLISYQHQHSAANAIVWCNGPASPHKISARNGYRKYCRQFLEKKRCQRPKCSLLHEWRAFADVLNQSKVRQLNHLGQSHSLQASTSSSSSYPPASLQNKRFHPHSVNKNQQCFKRISGYSRSPSTVSFWPSPRCPPNHHFQCQSQGIDHSMLSHSARVNSTGQIAPIAQMTHTRPSNQLLPFDAIQFIESMAINGPNVLDQR